MTSLLLGAQYITKEDLRYLSFCGEPINKQYIRSFSENLCISEACLSRVAMFPAPLVLRHSILLAFAAMKSEDFPERTVYGFKIAIRSNMMIGGQVFLDADGENVLYATARQGDTEKWEIKHLSPQVFSELYLYRDVFISSVLRACNDVYRNRI